MMMLKSNKYDEEDISSEEEEEDFLKDLKLKEKKQTERIMKLESYFSNELSGNVNLKKKLSNNNNENNYEFDISKYKFQTPKKYRSKTNDIFKKKRNTSIEKLNKLDNDFFNSKKVDYNYKTKNNFNDKITKNYSNLNGNYFDDELNDIDKNINSLEEILKKREKERKLKKFSYNFSTPTTTSTKSKFLKSKVLKTVSPKNEKMSTKRMGVSYYNYKSSSNLLQKKNRKLQNINRKLQNRKESSDNLRKYNFEYSSPKLTEKNKLMKRGSSKKIIVKHFPIEKKSSFRKKKKRNMLPPSPKITKKKSNITSTSKINPTNNLIVSKKKLSFKNYPVTISTSSDKMNKKKINDSTNFFSSKNLIKSSPKKQKIKRINTLNESKSIIKNQEIEKEKLKEKFYDAAVNYYNHRYLLKFGEDHKDDLEMDIFDKNDSRFYKPLSLLMKTSWITSNDMKFKIIKSLVRSGANVNGVSKSGLTALHLGCLSGEVGIIDFLIENGADIESKDIQGQTSLMKASSNGHIKVVEYLIGKGVKIDEKDNSGKDALFYAKEHTEILELLKGQKKVKKRERKFSFFKLLSKKKTNENGTISSPSPESINNEQTEKIIKHYKKKLLESENKFKKQIKKKEDEIKKLKREYEKMLKKQKEKFYKMKNFKVIKQVDHYDRMLEIPNSEIKKILNLDGENIILGIGGYGKVIKCKWERSKGDKIDVAVKILPINLSRYVIEKELKLVKFLDHPKVIKVYGYTRFQEDLIGIVMEYCEGNNLTKYMKKNTLSLIDKWYIAKKIIESIEYIHHKKVIHRDIKLENFLITRDKNIKISDFGMAKIKSSAISLSKNVHNLKGTIGYQAPELIGTLEPLYSFQSDIFALGISLYELFCGESPFTKMSDDTLILTFIKASLKKNPIIIKNEMIPNEMKKIVSFCCSYEKENRKSAKDILDFLNQNESDFLSRFNDYKHQLIKIDNLIGNIGESIETHEMDEKILSTCTDCLNQIIPLGKNLKKPEIFTLKIKKMIHNKMDCFNILNVEPRLALIKLFKELLELSLLKNIENKTKLDYELIIKPMREFCSRANDYLNSTYKDINDEIIEESKFELECMTQSINNLKDTEKKLRTVFKNIDNPKKLLRNIAKEFSKMSRAWFTKYLFFKNLSYHAIENPVMLDLMFSKISNNMDIKVIYGVVSLLSRISIFGKFKNIREKSYERLKSFENHSNSNIRRKVKHELIKISMQ